MNIEVDKLVAIWLNEASFRVGISYEDNNKEKRGFIFGIIVWTVLTGF